MVNLFAILCEREKQENVYVYAVTTDSGIPIEYFCKQFYVNVTSLETILCLDQISGKWFCRPVLRVVLFSYDYFDCK